jgi:PilZ domain-containing protein
LDTATLGQMMPLFQTLIWAVLACILVFGLRKELRKLLDRLTAAEDLQMSLGSLKVQAKTMRDLHRTIGAGFPDGTITKDELDALLDLKIKSIQAAMEHTLTKGDGREETRIPVNEKIKIIRRDGKVVYGTTIDASEAGIGFRSEHRLRFGEIVKIKPRSPEEKLPGNIVDPVRIVRIEESRGGFHYGATVYPAS